VSRNEQERLRDIKDAIASIHGHLARARKQPEAGDNALLHDALLFLFAVIGEGVKSLTPETQHADVERVITFGHSS